MADGSKREVCLTCVDEYTDVREEINELWGIVRANGELAETADGKAQAVSEQFRSWSSDFWHKEQRLRETIIEAQKRIEKVDSRLATLERSIEKIDAHAQALEAHVTGFAKTKPSER